MNANGYANFINFVEKGDECFVVQRPVFCIFIFFI